MKKIQILFKANKVYFNFLFKYGKLMILLQIFLLLLSSPLNLIQLYSPKNFLDSIIYDRDLKTAFFWILVLIISTITYSVISQLVTLYREYICSKCKLEAKISGYKHFQNLYLSYFEDNEKMNTVQRAMSYADNGGNSFYIFLTSLFSTIISFITVTYVSFKFEWWLWILILALFMCRLLISNKTKKLNYVFDKEQVNRNRITGYYASVLSQKKNLQELELFNATDLFVDKLKKSWLNNLIIKIKFRLKIVLINVSEIFPEKLLLLISYIFIGYRLLEGSATVGEYTLFFSMITQINSLLSSFKGIITGFYEQSLSAQNYVDFIEDKNDYIEFNDTCIDLPNDEILSIELNEVTFKYNNQLFPAINNVSLKINKGEKISIVGTNGAGKTTLIKLILSLYKPASGEILINNIQHHQIKIKSYWKKIGVVFQNHNVYSVTIAENILFNENPDSEKVISVLEMVNLKDKVIGFENGINTLVSPSLHKGGVDFSGGERQKIAIARAFAKNCDLYIFDEPSSALDARSEDELFNIIKSLPEDKTVIFISHRLSSVSASDRIIVMKNGCIIGDGSHDSLMRDCKEYFDMYSVQAKRYGATI